MSTVFLKKNYQEQFCHEKICSRCDTNTKKRLHIAELRRYLLDWVSTLCYNTYKEGVKEGMAP